LSEYKQCLNETLWRDLLSFTAAAKAKMIFGLSMNTGEDLVAVGAGSYSARSHCRVVPPPTRSIPGLRRDSAPLFLRQRRDRTPGAGPGGYPFPWDPSNARAILEWTMAQQLDHLIFGFELGMSGAE
jgi:hypothetical protein